MSQIVFFGLGNPGPQYAKTRHNAGFLVLDRFLEFQKNKFKEEFRHSGNFVFVKAFFKESEVILIKPMTYMNLSGEAFITAKNKFDFSLENCIIVFDDFSIASGKIRLKKSGTDGGQKGIRDIIEKSGTTRIKRIKIGIQETEFSEDMADFVTSEPTGENKVLFENALGIGAKAMETIIYSSFERAMNLFNNKGGE